MQRIFENPVGYSLRLEKSQYNQLIEISERTEKDKPSVNTLIINAITEYIQRQQPNYYLDLSPQGAKP